MFFNHFILNRFYILVVILLTDPAERDNVGLCASKYGKNDKKRKKK